MVVAETRDAGVGIDRSVPWDSKLRESVAPAQLASVSLHLDSFRRFEWKQIVRELRGHGWHVPDGLEPCWVGPGRAVLWQRQLVRVRGVEEDRGFAPTSGLPVGNARQLAYWLEKGLLLRPPLPEGVEESPTGVEAAPSPEAPEVPTVEYLCGRHEQGELRFKTWKAYMRHTVRHGEVPEGEPPAEVMERRAASLFYCDVHDTPILNEKAAKFHIQLVHQRQKSFPSVTLEMLRTGKGA